MSEPFDVYRPPSGERSAVVPAGYVESRLKVHVCGLWHRTSLCWFGGSTADGDWELVLQRRSRHKDTNPGCWDITVAGHVDAGGVPLTTVVREIEEELGVTVDVVDPLTNATLHCSFDRLHNPTADSSHESIVLRPILCDDPSRPAFVTRSSIDDPLDQQEPTNAPSDEPKGPAEASRHRQSLRLLLRPVGEDPSTEVIEGDLMHLFTIGHREKGEIRRHGMYICCEYQSVYLFRPARPLLEMVPAPLTDDDFQLKLNHSPAAEPSSGVFRPAPSEVSELKVGRLRQIQQALVSRHPAFVPRDPLFIELLTRALGKAAEETR
ncbi:unnamed protein product [Vitrella brassicaformis CCMP3155]|uniref:Nudix hydrolase domain-containing protein n=1 Tax=Vitrella brassicaformis (strain CCMP3155) TaxID=1169540 RepID=A0A0G4EZC1_VITBC|nr:unnamed protein product [Vitrella brassicaformis CCMP3155]|eukprot:CEM04663.1 unnamed protein product [Vitrella brassicaformis CCMP3155]